MNFRKLHSHSSGLVSRSQSLFFFDFCEYLPRPTIEIPMPNLSSPTEASGDQPLGI